MEYVHEQNPWQPTRQNLDLLLSELDFYDAFDPFSPAWEPAAQAHRREKEARKGKGLNIAIAAMLLLIAMVVGPKLFGVQLRAVLTGSMEPELPVGSLIVAAPAPFEKVKVGDDVTFVINKDLKVVTHRVIAKDEGNQMVTTKGVANKMSDAPTRYENVLGVVRFHVPYVGYPLLWLGTAQGKIISIAAFAAILLILLLAWLYSRNRKARSRNRSDA